MANQVLSLIPHFADYVTSRLEYMFVRLFSSRQLTIVVDERTGLYRNQMFDDSETYLRSKLTTDSASSMHRIKAGKTPRDKKLLLDFENNEKINDIFHGIQLKWKLLYYKEEKPMAEEKKWFELIFDKKHKGIVLDSYLPYVMKESEFLREKNKVLKLYTPSRLHGDLRGSGPWRSINLEHPATFHTLAMAAKLKTAVIQDLHMFVKRRKFYRRVGKAWKRGYLLYGPPGTGKSSLIAAMANYLNYDIYDLDLASIFRNTELRELLISTTNRSILVIEDIDCSVDMETRRNKGGRLLEDQCCLTLSGLLNCIDGLWSSCGDERIIVVTTNYKDQLDPALLRPGRMDMHIHMSYCTPCDFRFLAFRYLRIHDHPLFKLIEQLIEEVQVTPAEVAEELMKSNDVEVILNGLIDFIGTKNVKNGVKRQEKDNEVEGRVDGIECEGLKGENIEIQTYKKRRVRKLLSSGDVGEPSVATIGKSTHPNGKSFAPLNVKASNRKALGSKKKKGF